MATRNMWAPPRYEESQQQGRPHERTFSIKCSLQDQSEIRHGPRKKIAKQRAAEKVLLIFESKGDAPAPNVKKPKLE